MLMQTARGLVGYLDDERAEELELRTLAAEAGRRVAAAPERNKYRALVRMGAKQVRQELDRLEQRGWVAGPEAATEARKAWLQVHRAVWSEQGELRGLIDVAIRATRAAVPPRRGR